VLFHDKELIELMKNFYVLTGMRIVLFDESFNEIVAYPENAQGFCDCMRKNPEFYRMCCKSDSESFKNSRKTMSLTVYECHAGLTEATAPIISNDKIIGYMMFGQISMHKNKDKFQKKVLELCNKYNMPESAKEQIDKIKYRSRKQIQAAAKILEACAGYIQLKELVQAPKKELIDSIEEFTDIHIKEKITVNRLCKEFNISRTRLYDTMRHHIIGGIATFIRNKRMQKAKQLICTTDLSIAEIADAVGFDDYNYFLRVFKQSFGISPRNMQKKKKSKNY